MSSLAGAYGDAGGQVGLAGAGWAEEHDVVAGFDEVERAEVSDHVTASTSVGDRSRSPRGSCGPGTVRRGCGFRRRGPGVTRPRVRDRRPGTPHGSSPRPWPVRPAVRPRRPATVP